ncbi:MAG: phosphatidylinositol-specific phospholipase C [Actinomycetota bacterium]|nr:phosphatidylinositol-specific phospholipase C [Actinomycetota bacterium]
MMDEFIANASWMRDISDGTPMTMLSIPGTHNSCCTKGPLGFGKTQNLDLADQLSAGIRFLDIRLTHCQNKLCVHHDVVCTGKGYTEVLDVSDRFLKRHPSETILMSVKDESCCDSAGVKLSPYQAFCKLSIGVENGRENTQPFEDTFKAETWDHIGDMPLFYNFAAAPPGTNPASIAPALTSETTLGEVRGKVVLLRRFEASQDVGFDLTYWPENQRFRSSTPPFYDVEDRYQNPGDDDKFDFVIAHLREAERSDPNDLYITFSSAVGLTARGSEYSNTINPRLNDYLARSRHGRVGIIVMDFFEHPRELVSNVIKTNFPTGVIGDHDGRHAA